jgi:polar amino acid transport system substrate-binding protein
MTMFAKTVLWVGIFLLMTATAAEAEMRLRIAYPHFPPFHFMDEKGSMAGFFHGILTEALERRMGVTVVWTAYPWTRCQENLKSGTDDAVITVPTPERAVFTVTHRDPFYLKPLHLFTYADHPQLSRIGKIRRIADLKAGGFSVITYSGNGWHKNNIEPLGVKTYESAYLENVWKMLAEKRGDTVIEWPLGAWPDIRRAGVADRIVDTGVKLSAMPFHLLIRKGYPRTDLLADFNATIGKMKADGAINRILAAYQ